MKKCILRGVLLLACFCLFPYVFFGDNAGQKEKAKAFIGNLAGGRYSDCVLILDKAMKDALPADKLESTWKIINKQAGAFKKILDTRIEKTGTYSIVFVTCEFERTLLDAKVVFTRDESITGLFFVPSEAKTSYSLPSYAKPDSFVETEVVVYSNEWKLPGTLALPKGTGPFPAVILIHGSGPQDKDESIGPNKPFKDLSIGLASNGIAVLRYEKRTKIYGDKSTKNIESITLKEEVTDDVFAACELLRKTEKIDKNRVFLLGHSLGGMLIPKLGMLDKNVSGLIILAGNTRPLEDLLLEQTKYLFSVSDSLPQKEKEEQIAKLMKQVEKIKSRQYNLNTPAEELPLGVSPAYWQDLQKCNPVEVVKELKQSLLILQGERDYQVTMEDFKGWQISLKGRNNAEFKSYVKLNHLFMEGKGKSTPQEYAIENHIAEYVIKDIADWIKKQK